MDVRRHTELSWNTPEHHWNTPEFRGDRMTPSGPLNKRETAIWQCAVCLMDPRASYDHHRTLGVSWGYSHGALGCSGSVLGVFWWYSKGVRGCSGSFQLTNGLQTANKRPTNDQQTIPTHPAPAAGVPSRVWGLFVGRLWSFVGRLLAVCWLNTPEHLRTPLGIPQAPPNKPQITIE